MSSTTLISQYLRKKAAGRLRALGRKVDRDSTMAELSAAVASVRGIRAPSDMAERTMLVRSFAQAPFVVQVDVERIPFVPLRLSKPMLEAIERAHELYAIPSLMDRLEGKA